jgi:hypothetical protein
MNRWNIPRDLETIVRQRDKRCVYCGCAFAKSDRKRTASWEHIVNDATIINLDNIVLCCVSYNASKGARQLMDWLQSDYCKQRRISASTVSAVVKKATRSSRGARLKSRPV